VKPAGAAHGVGAGDGHRVKRVGDRLEVPLRQVQIDNRVFEFDVPEQELDCPQVGTRLDEV
jgi:hypothetical protein